MPDPIRLMSPYVLAQADLVRSDKVGRNELLRTLQVLGVEVAKVIIEQFCLQPSQITTPMGVGVVATLPKVPMTVVITTKGDAGHFGKGISVSLDKAPLGWMDFDGQRGTDALTNRTRSQRFPSDPRLQGRPVDLLVIAKGVVATGCTAISLTRNAYARYTPRRLVIAAIYHSNEGVADLQAEFPNADIFVVGHADALNEDGLLVPGVGLLDQRIGA